MRSLVAALAFSLIVVGCRGASSPAVATSTQPVASSTVAVTATAAATAEAGLAAANLVPIRQYIDAINRGDATGALVPFADDVVWERGGQCPAGKCVNKTAVAGEVARDVAAHHRLTPLSVDTSGAGAVVRLELRNDGTQRANVERVIQLFAFQLRGAQISAVTVSFDGSDAVTAAFVASQAGTRR
jgi:hypothetical protein